MPGSELLMHGHAPHDARLQTLLEDSSRTRAVLWPSEDAITVTELQVCSL